MKEKKNKEWYAFTKEKIKFIDIMSLDNNSGYKYKFSVRKPNLSFNDNINEDGYTVNEKLTKYHLFPKWELFYKKEKYDKDLRNIYLYLKDSLFEFNPVMVFKDSYGPIYSNLTKISYNDYGNSVPQNDWDKYYIEFEVQLIKAKKLPKILENIDIIVKSELLPNSKYEYGFCRILDGRFQLCNDEAYLKNGGGILDTHPWGYCQTFIKSKGNSNIKCKIDIGN